MSEHDRGGAAERQPVDEELARAAGAPAVVEAVRAGAETTPTPEESALEEAWVLADDARWWLEGYRPDVEAEMDVARDARMDLSGLMVQVRRREPAALRNDTATMKRIAGVAWLEHDLDVRRLRYSVHNHRERSISAAMVTFAPEGVGDDPSWAGLQAAVRSVGTAMAPLAESMPDRYQVTEAALRRMGECIRTRDVPMADLVRAIDMAHGGFVQLEADNGQIIDRFGAVEQALEALHDQIAAIRGAAE